MARHHKLAAVLLTGSLSVLGPVVTSDAAETSRGVATDTSQRAVRPKASLQMHPQIAQPGAGVAAASTAKSAMTATLRPRKNGRPVLLQRKQGKRWVKVAKARQKGIRAEFAAPYARNGRPVTYRVSAGRYRGLKPVRSAGVSTAAANATGFLDNFGGTALDSSRWVTRDQDYGATPNRRCSATSSDATTVSGGTAKVRVMDDPDRPGGLLDTRPEKCSFAGKKYAWRLNGHVGTRDNYSFTYGYAAARIKFQPRRGQHGAFWMMPQSQTAPEGSAKDTGAEIDVIEYFGNKAPYGGLTSFIHHWPDNLKPGVTSKKVGSWIRKPTRFGKDWAKRYHVFSVEWTPKRYVFRIDGRETFRTSKGVSGRPQYLILSLLSSDYELKQLGGDGNLPQTMNIDWVRTWER